jgi:glycosyltransferase involved in cell wall biosynthesis
MAHVRAYGSDESRCCVMHLTSSHWAADARVFHKECRSLSNAGYRTILIAPYTQDDVIHGVDVRALPLTHRWRRVLLSPLRVYRKALRQPTDCYHIHDPELLPIALLLKWQNKRVIYDAHEDLPRTLLSKPYLPKWLHQPMMWLTERLENFAARRCDAIVAATPNIAQRFDKLHLDTRVVGNFPRLEELAPAADRPWSKRRNSVVYLGSITRDRGVRDLVEAMGLVPAHFGARLKLAGFFHDQDLRNEIERMPGWAHVDWLGYLTRQEIAALLSNSRLGVVVLHPEQAFMESQPVKLYEYMAAGIPVVASDFPAWQAMVDGCGLTVAPKSPQDLANAITYLLSHPEAAELMGRQGRVKVQQQYNWSNEERNLLRLYADLLAPADRQPVFERCA